MSGSERAATSGFVRFLAMVGKELLELTRSFKLIWVPLVFVVLGIMQPVVSYYMPVILEKAGNMPEGTVIQIPLPGGEQVLAETLSQFGTLGALILVLAFMGTVSGERGSGAASMILVKPVSVVSYLLSKWTSMLLLTWSSLLAGYGAAWYYTWLLIEGVEFERFVAGYLIYGLWFGFIMTLTLLFSTALRSAAGAAFSALGAAAALSLLAGLMPRYAGWTPGALAGFAYEAVGGDIADTASFRWAAGTALLLIAAALAASVRLLRRAPAID